MKNKKNTNVNLLVKASLLAALSIVLMYVVRFPIFPQAAYLEYDMADVPILIGTFMFGPAIGLAITFIVCIIQALSVSASSGWVGAVMHFVSTGGLVLVAGLIYKKMHTRKGAVIGLTVGGALMVLLMIPLNLIMTPLFNGVPVDVVKGMLVPIIIPFNAIKAAINCTVTFIVYKALGKVLKQDITEKTTVHKGISIRKTVYCGVFIALGITLPFLTSVSQLGNALLLMHLPVMVCGIVCGGGAAAIVGALTPIIRSAMFGLPVMYPNAIGMAFELAVYGLVIGIMMQKLPKKIPYYYISLISAMLLGRLVWGGVRFAMFAIDGSGAAFSLAMFMSGAFSNAIIGIIIQLALIPFLAAYLNKKTDLPVK